MGQFLGYRTRDEAVGVVFRLGDRQIDVPADGPDLESLIVSWPGRVRGSDIGATVLSAARSRGLVVDLADAWSRATEFQAVALGRVAAVSTDVQHVLVDRNGDLRMVTPLEFSVWVLAPRLYTLAELAEVLRSGGDEIDVLESLRLLASKNLIALDEATSG
ncbi:hypothetical protein [Tsukamurella sp. PLM1]|uniref:hypothetical protein n=1 Tax=Tsukamurella sp. PLM1 TaxID=2929795 RepID=UPI0020C13C62|nr:hypothetical protein [Tsukamurella sp. PLM1]